MAIKRIVPKSQDSVSNVTQFQDGPRTLIASETPFLSINCVTLTGKRREQLTYREWLEQVVSRVNQSTIFQREVSRQIHGHFAGIGLG